MLATGRHFLAAPLAASAVRGLSSAAKPKGNFLAKIALQKKSLGGKIPANSPEYSTDKRRLFVLFFSAANDSDCQVFTRKITAFHDTVQGDALLNFVWISLDSNADEQNKSLAKLPDWPYVAYDDSNIKWDSPSGTRPFKYLKSKFAVSGGPTVRLVNFAGDVLRDGTRKEIEEEYKKASALVDKWRLEPPRNA